jgi:hypothetical protein
VNSVTDGNDLFPSVAMDADGDFAVGWHVKDGAGRYDVYLRRYNAAGQTGAEYHVAQTPGNSLNASVAMGAQGKGVVAWQHVPASGVP